MRYITKDDLAKILRIALKASRRDHLIILLSAQHGLRRSEVAALTLDDIAGAKIAVRRCKGSWATTQALIASDSILFDELRALAYYLEERRAGTDLLFPSSHGGPLSGKQINNIAKKYMLAAGVPKELAHAHSLKHACGAILVHSGVDIAHVARYLGHKDCKNTINFYAHISDEEASAKAQEVFR